MLRQVASIINGATAVYNNTSSSSVKDASWFIRDGAEVTLTGAAGMTLKNAINGFRIKDRYDQAYRARYFYLRVLCIWNYKSVVL
jgi:hypothetical protein